ncbi:hypothetical protein K449DRAFT_246080 [Hypoxylon sp. EC38]|nr:hypothetical protein K449DRAFT_246080 [Hypoxylon sp. EC38]
MVGIMRPMFAISENEGKLPSMRSNEQVWISYGTLGTSPISSLYVLYLDYFKSKKLFVGWAGFFFFLPYILYVNARRQTSH